LHQLPSPPRDFTGREDELAKLRDAIINGGAVIGLRGMGGVGKTALALVLAENLKDCFPDAQLFLDLRGSCPNPMTPAQAMLHIIHGFFPEYQPKGGDTELQGMYCSVLEGKHTLLLMDNARDSRHVEPLVPPKNCALIVTSREHILLPGLMAKDVTCLSMGDAEQLLLKIAPRIGDAVNEIAKLCGCLPLALRLAASAFAERPDLSSQEYTSRLRDAKKRLELVEASLSSSYYLLDPDKQKILRMLAVFPDAFHYSAAAEVWKMELEQARNALAELFRFSLVEFDEHRTRYQLHDMVRLFAESRLSDEERTDSRQRHAEHYVDVLKLTNHLYMLGGNSILQGLSVFDAEWKHIQAAQEWASTNADINPNAADLCVKYTEVSTYCLNLRQNPRERIHWLELAINSAQKIGDRKREGYALGNLGIAYAALGKYRRAIKLHEQALHICREIGNRRGEGTSLGNLGNVYAAMGEPQRAIEFHKQALHIYREIGHRRGEGANLGNLGIAYAALGEPHRAIEFYEQAIQIAREIGDRWGEGIGLGNLGYAYAALGDPRRAIEFFEKALQIFRKIGDRRGEGTCLGNLGNAYGTLGDPRRAIEFYEQALNISREIGHREGESTDLGNLGSAYAALGEFHRAIEFHEQALQIAREIGDRRGECTCLDNMGLTYTALGDTGRAIDFYGQAIQIAREIGDRRGEAIPSWNLGIQARKEGDLQRAITLMQLRVDYEREIGHSNAEKSAAILDDLKVQAKNANMGNRHKRHMRKLKKK
jgi:tetratricopeptide (TPR) repeat protein